MNKIIDATVKQIVLSNRKIYIAGPMSGIREFNRPAFFAAEEYLIEHGAKVMNPATLPIGFEHHEYMKIAMPMLDACDVVAFLPGWQLSKGARVEFTTAHHSSKLLLGLDVEHVAGKPWIKSHGPLMI